MVRSASMGLGVALLVVAIAALATGAVPWLAEVHVVAAICSFVVALVAEPGDEGGLAVGMPAVLSLSLLVVWLCAVTARSTPWLTWLTLGASMAWAVVAYLGMPGRRGRLHLGHAPAHRHG